MASSRNEVSRLNDVLMDVSASKQYWYTDCITSSRILVRQHMSAGLDKSTDADGRITFAGRRGRSEGVERMTNLGGINVAIIAQRYFNNVFAQVNMASEHRQRLTSRA